MLGGDAFDGNGPTNMPQGINLLWSKFYLACPDMANRIFYLYLYKGLFYVYSGLNPDLNSLDQFWQSLMNIDVTTKIDIKFKPLKFRLYLNCVWTRVLPILVLIIYILNLCTYHGISIRQSRKNCGGNSLRGNGGNSIGSNNRGQQ